MLNYLGHSAAVDAVPRGGSGTAWDCHPTWPLDPLWPLLNHGPGWEQGPQAALPVLLIKRRDLVRGRRQPLRELQTWLSACLRDIRCTGRPGSTGGGLDLVIG